MERNTPFIVQPGEGKHVDIGGLGVVFKVWGEATGHSLSIVEHPMAPGRLVPPHIHTDEDELSYVLEGTFGVRIGDQIATAGPGAYIYKPRGIPHTFWNAGNGPARLIEIIWPATFEHFFATLAEVVRTAESQEVLEQQRAELGTRYHLEFVPGWADALKAQYGLKLLGEP